MLNIRWPCTILFLKTGKWDSPAKRSCSRLRYWLKQTLPTKQKFSQVEGVVGADEPVSKRPHVCSLVPNEDTGDAEDWITEEMAKSLKRRKKDNIRSWPEYAASATSSQMHSIHPAEKPSQRQRGGELNHVSSARRGGQRTGGTSLANGISKPIYRPPNLLASIN
jgi:hypothetical protein